MKNKLLVFLTLILSLYFNFTYSFNVKAYDNVEDKDIQVINYTNKNIYLSKRDLYLMAQVVEAESESEPFEGKVAVASVILNRTVNSKFPDSIEKVIKQKGAFSCISKNGNITKVPSHNSFKAVSQALNGKDPTNHALFFYNPDISTCCWMKNVSKHNKIIIGKHVFFKIH